MCRRCVLREDEVVQLGCVVCRNLGYFDSPAEIHHLREGTGMGRKDERFIGFCPLHHRTGGRGVAFHAGRRIWESRYGTQEELYKQTEELLNETEK